MSEPKSLGCFAGAVIYPAAVLGGIGYVVSLLMAVTEPNKTDLAFQQNSDGAVLSKTQQMNRWFGITTSMETFKQEWQLSKGLYCQRHRQYSTIGLLPSYSDTSSCRPIMQSDFPAISIAAKHLQPAERQSAGRVHVTYTPVAQGPLVN